MRQAPPPIKATYQGFAVVPAAKASPSSPAAKDSAAKTSGKVPAAAEPKAQILKRVGDNLYRSDQSRILYRILTINNRQIRRSLKTKNKATGRQRLEKLRLLVAQGQSQPRRRAQNVVVGFVELANRWLDVASSVLATSTANRRRHSIKAIAPFFPDRISREVVEKWSVIRSTLVKPATFNKELETIQLVCGYAVDHGILLENPAGCLIRRRIIKPLVVIPTREQFGNLVAEMRQHHRGNSAADLIELLAYSGCRLGEALSLRWGDVDLFQARVVVGADGHTKSGKSRVIPLFAPLRRLLTAIGANG